MSACHGNSCRKNVRIIIGSLLMNMILEYFFYIYILGIYKCSVPDDPHLVAIVDLNFLKKTFPCYLTSVCDLWPHEHMKVPILYPCFKFGCDWTYTFDMGPFPCHLNFDLDMWHLTSWTYGGTHVPSLVAIRPELYEMRPISMLFEIGMCSLTFWT